MHRGNGIGPSPGMGDLPSRPAVPTETYFSIDRAQQLLTRRPWILQPQVDPRFIKGLEAQQTLIRHELMPDLWEMMKDFLVMQTKMVYFTKRPNWVEPPASAEGLDQRNEVGVAVGAADTTVVTFTVPDRYLVILWKFGHMLSLSQEWGNVIWNIFDNDRPVRSYQDFRRQIGTYVDPTAFLMPVIITGNHNIRITARTTGAAVNAFARIMGFQFPAKMISQDGTFQPFYSQ